MSLGKNGNLGIINPLSLARYRDRAVISLRLPFAIRKT
jgi:hypothetical protein